MSQFRIKKIDTGLIDEWAFRINDNGAIPGDDVVAEDPNELAQAVSDTQELLLKASVYAPNLLINASSGALERIKIIEDTVGATSLQDAYDNGRFISVAPGRPLSFGALGEIELDSSGNLKINPSTFKITNGVNDMLLSEAGVQSSNSNLIFGTSGTKDTTVQAGNDLYLNDGSLSAAITLSEAGSTALLTTAQSLVGAINEISSGFTGTDFQQIYGQSSPPTITTTFAGGSVKIVNGSGNPNTPALTIEGGIDCIDFLDADKLTVGPGAAINLTIESDGSLDTVGDIQTSTKLISPRLENTVGDITFVDSRGSTTLTEIGDGSLSTVKQSLFGSLNEVNSLALQNATYLSALDLEHDLTTGVHEIINTQSAIGSEATSRLNIKDGSGVTKISMNALGEMAAEELTLGVYTVTSELAANVAHRSNDGTSHSAVATHLSAANPHSVVKTFGKFGDIGLSGDVTISEGSGITIVRSGQDIEIATSSGNTLQSVYTTQVDGNLVLDTTGGKDLFFRDSSNILIMSLDDSNITTNKNIVINNVGATIAAVSDLGIQAGTNLAVSSTAGHVSIGAPALGKVVNIEGIPFTDGSASPALDASLTQDTVGAINDLAGNNCIVSENATGTLVTKGTGVVLREDGKFWIPYPDPAEAGAVLGIPLNADIYWHGVGVADEDIAASTTGRIRISGKISANIGEPSLGIGWRPGDELYISRVGYSEAEIISTGLLSNNDTITFDTAVSAKVYTAKTSGANPALGEFNISGNANPNTAVDITRNNLIDTLNNETYMATANAFYVRAFVAGDTAIGRMVTTGTGTAGDTVVLTPGASMPGSTITLTAVANGTSPAWLEYELGTSAAETAIFIAEAINRTYGSDGVGGDGHLCSATVYNVGIEVEWAGPGKMGNSMVISDTSATITSPGNLTGGTSKVHVYRSKRAANGILCTQSNAAGMTCDNFTDDEGGCQYLNQIQWFITDRERKDDDRRIKLGKVIAYVDPITTFIVQPEAPRKNRRRLKGVPYDTEY